MIDCPNVENEPVVALEPGLLDLCVLLAVDLGMIQLELKELAKDLAFSSKKSL